MHELVEKLQHGRVTISAVVQVLQIVIQFWMMPVNEVFKRDLYMIRKTFVPWGCFVRGATKGTDRAEAVRLRIHRIDWAVISCARNLSRNPVMRVGNDLASSGHDLDFGCGAACGFWRSRELARALFGGGRGCSRSLGP